MRDVLRWITPIVVGLLLVVMSGCDSGGTGGEAIELSDAASAAGWIAVDPIEVSLPTSDPVGDAGETGPASTDGDVIVNIFRASYCAPCRDEMPVLEDVAQGGRVEVVGVTRDTRASYAERSMRQAGVTYPNYADADATLAIDLDGRVPLNAIPATVLVRDGVAVAVHVGELKTAADVLSVLEVGDA